MIPSFQQNLFESIFEYYIYHFAYLKSYIQETYRSDIPCYYYRHKELSSTFFSRVDAHFKVDISAFSSSELKILQEIVSSLQNNTFDFASFLLSFDSRLCFLFQDTKFPHILNPQFLSSSQVESLLSLLKEPHSFLTFYLSQWAIVYFANKGNNDLDSFFDFCFLVDEENPFLLARYARFLWSAKYKLTRDSVLLERAEQALLKSIHCFWDQIVPFVYGWLWYIYIEQKKYQDALDIMERNIQANADYGHEQAESFIWKSLALNKLKRYKESYDLCFRIKNNTIINDKKDFRFYRLFADTCFHLERWSDFRIYLEKCIELLLWETSIHITHLWYTYTFTNDTLSSWNLFFWFSDMYYKNAFDWFLEYNKEKITNSYREIIYMLGFFEKERILWRQTSFKETRNVEVLCFEYVASFYHWY
jgi:hypothetical protein